MEGHIEVASTLISKATLLLHQVDKDGRTPLHLASANGHKDLLTIMIGQGAEIDAQDNVSDTGKVSSFSPLNRKIFDAFSLRKLKKLSLQSKVILRQESVQRQEMMKAPS